MLKGYFGFNLRERLNLYGGMALGALAPIVAIKYALTASGAINPQGTLGEIFAWGMAAIGAFPWIVGSTAGGLMAGYISARHLRDKRIDRERERESKLEKEV